MYVVRRRLVAMRNQLKSGHDDSSLAVMGNDERAGSLGMRRAVCRHADTAKSQGVYQ